MQENKKDEGKPASNPVKKEKKKGHAKRKGDEEEVKPHPKLFRGKVVELAAVNSTKTSKPASKKRDVIATFDEKDDEFEGKGGAEDVKPPASKKKVAEVYLEDEDDDDERPYRKRIIGRNNIRPPLPHKLVVRSPKKKEEDDPTFSNYSKQSEDGTFDDDDVFGCEKVKEDSTICFLVYTMKCFL